MITVDVRTWTELVEAFNNGGTKYIDDVTIKLISDIDCNGKIPETLAIPESPADMKDVSELYSDGFDVQQPNSNSVGDNNG